MSSTSSDTPEGFCTVPWAGRRERIMFSPICQQSQRQKPLMDRRREKQSTNQSHESNGEKRGRKFSAQWPLVSFWSTFIFCCMEAEEVGPITSNSYFSPSLFVHQTRALPRLSLPHKSKRRPFGGLFRSFPGLCNYWSCYSNTLSTNSSGLSWKAPEKAWPTSMACWRR